VANRSGWTRAQSESYNLKRNLAQARRTEKAGFALSPALSSLAKHYDSKRKKSVSVFGIKMTERADKLIAVGVVAFFIFVLPGLIKKKPSVVDLSRGNSE
jgi:hypothetical protein